MKKITWFFLVLSLIGMTATACGQREHPFKVYAWMSGKLDMPDDVLENYFSQAAAAGISGIYLECHGGYPTLLGDTTAFRDSAALVILRRAVPYAKKYGLDPDSIQDIVNDMESDGIRVTKEDIEDMYLNDDLF